MFKKAHMDVMVRCPQIFGFIVYSNVFIVSKVQALKYLPSIFLLGSTVYSHLSNIQMTLNRINQLVNINKTTKFIKKQAN